MVGAPKVSRECELPKEEFDVEGALVGVQATTKEQS